MLTADPRLAAKYSLRCVRCRWEAEPSLTFHCPRCHGALDAVIDCGPPVVRDSTQPEIAYFDFLPLVSTEHLLPHISRATSCRRATDLGSAIGVPDLWLKDESAQPTGSTKDRLAAMVLAVFRCFGVSEFVCASTGNTALALARAVSLDGTMAAHFFCGTTACGIDELRTFPGNTFHAVDGSYADAIGAAREFAERNDLLQEGGFFNWARREGLKIAYFEAFDEMPVAPHVVVQAISSGMGIMAAHKAAQEFYSAGRIAHLPQFLMVQQDTCAPMVKGWQRAAKELDQTDVVDDPDGLASAILMGDASASYSYMRDIALATQSTMVEVTQDQLIEARGLLRELASVDVCYSSAATLAAVKNEAAAGRLAPDRTVLLNLTGRLRDTPRPATAHQNCPPRTISNDLRYV